MQMKVKLGDMFEIGSGGTPSKTHPEYYGGDIPWVKTGDLKSEYLYEVEDFITEEGLNNSSAKVYDTDTVLIAMYGATIGATSILKMSACTNQACAAFKKNADFVATETFQLSVPAPSRALRKSNERSSRTIHEMPVLYCERYFASVRHDLSQSVASLRPDAHRPLPSHSADYLKFGILVI